MAPLLRRPTSAALRFPFQYARLTHKVPLRFWPGRAGQFAFKELPACTFRIKCLSSGFFFDWHQFIAELLSLPSKELPACTFRIKCLSSGFFFDWHQFIAELLSLPFEFLFEPFLPLGVALRPKRGVVFDLVLHHCVEDDRDLVGGRGGGRSRSEFALHPAEIVSQRRLIVMQRIGGQSK